MQARVNLLRAVTRRGFSQASALDVRYADFVAARKSKLEKAKVYQHPLENEDRPINFSPAHEMYMQDQLTGPEQVSTHYESFFVSRRFALTGLGMYAAMAYLSKFTDLNWGLKTIMAGLPLYFGLSIFLFEIPKYQFLPFLNRFYILTFNNELRMMQDAVPEEVQALVDKNMKEALGQFDFLLLNKKFGAIKEESIRAFLRNQELELKQGVKERAADLLKMAEDFETANQKALLGKIVDAVSREVEAVMKQPPKEMVAAAFESALNGIKEGKMTYKGDLALDYVLKKVRAESAKFKNLSPEQ